MRDFVRGGLALPGRRRIRFSQTRRTSRRERGHRGERPAAQRVKALHSAGQEGPRAALRRVAFVGCPSGRCELLRPPPGGRGRLTHAMTDERRRAWTLVLCCLAQFMVILDVSIVNVALPSIAPTSASRPPSLQWVVNGYTLAFAGFLLLGGRAADLLGRRRCSRPGCGLFALASLAGGAGAEQRTLVAARGGAGPRRRGRRAGHAVDPHDAFAEGARAQPRARLLGRDGRRSAAPRARSLGGLLTAGARLALDPLHQRPDRDRRRARRAAHRRATAGATPARRATSTSPAR